MKNKTMIAFGNLLSVCDSLPDTTAEELRPWIDELAADIRALLAHIDAQQQRIETLETALLAVVRAVEASTGTGIWCSVCDKEWEYDTVPLHGPDCPVAKARALLGE